ncbi:MAG TPA: hypothetical protein VHE77_02765 [Dongiaceae bacterium]|nr:hypothetical protein [Dongiaceae bacterium]
MGMRLGFHDAEELRDRHAALQERSPLERMQFARQMQNAHCAVDASWKTLERSRALVENADRFSRDREIHALVDDLIAQQRELIALRDDGAMLAAMAPRPGRR